MRISDDDELAQQLGALIAAADQPPTDVIQAAEAAWTWRTIDAELALMAFDSLDPELAAAPRGEGRRQLTFSLDEHEVDIEIDRSRVVVIFDHDDHQVRCETPDGMAWNAIIVDGQCEGDLPNVRPIRFVVDEPSGSTVIATPWFLP